MIDSKTNIRYFKLIFVCALLLLYFFLRPKLAEVELSQTKEAVGYAVNPNQPFIVHSVFLNIKDHLDESQKEEILADLQKVKDIEVVKKFSVGPFINLQDDRAMKDLELAMVMHFKNEEDYLTYQKHPIHLALKEKLSPVLSAPPTTYDFLEQ